MKVQASIKNYRRSASKVREIVPVVKGLSVGEADLQLRYLKKGSARDLLGLLLSAVANAKNNFNLEEGNLFVVNLVVNEGRVMKRWRARAHGRAAKILKRSCHVILTLEEKKVKKEVSKEVSNSKKRDSKNKKETGRKDQKNKTETENSKKIARKNSSLPSSKDKTGKKDQAKATNDK